MHNASHIDKTTLREELLHNWQYRRGGLLSLGDGTWWRWWRHCRWWCCRSNRGGLAIAAGAQNVDFWGAVWKGAVAGAAGGLIGGSLAAIGQTYSSVSFLNNSFIYGPLAGSGGAISGAALYGKSGTDLAIAAGLGAGAGLFAAGLTAAINRLSQPEGRVILKPGERFREGSDLPGRLLELSQMADGKEVNVHDGQRTLAEQLALFNANLTTNNGSRGTAPHVVYDGADISIMGFSHQRTASLAYRSGLFTRIALYTGHVHVDLKPVPFIQFFLANPSWQYEPGGP